MRLAGILALICAATVIGCGGEGAPSSPTSFTSLTAPGASLQVRPLDGHEPPVPGPMPDPAPAPVPATVTVNIVGSAGTLAFLPNPIQAAVGDLIVWTNTDRVLHRIVLDDGTPVGDVAPGASSVPIGLTSAAATYHCTIHPSMVGSINGGAAPVPPPDYGPPPDPYPDPYYDTYRR